MIVKPIDQTFPHSNTAAKHFIALIAASLDVT